MEHLGQPVEGGIGVAPPEALDEGARRVVVIVPSSIVDHRLLLDTFGGCLQGDANSSCRAKGSCSGGNLKGIQAFSGIPVADCGKMTGCCFLEVDGERPKSSFRIGDGPLLQVDKVLNREGLKLENLRAGDQRAVDRKERILSRRPDETHRTTLNVGEKRILLGLIEAMNLIDE